MIRSQQLSCIFSDGPRSPIRRTALCYVKLEKLNLKTHSEFNERRVQDRIAEDPSILGLGDLILRDKERIQFRAGRMHLVLQEADGNRRYEVEVQSGATDESGRRVMLPVCSLFRADVKEAGARGAVDLDRLLKHGERSDP